MFGIAVMVDYLGNYHTRVFKLVWNITGFGFNINNNTILYAITTVTTET